ncbi:MAG: lipid-A-disaccharide synthase [Granulosicoccus sp.]
MGKRYTLMVSAGEASGDAHAAQALSALHNQGLEFDSFGMGAGKLAAIGTEVLVDCRDLAVIGIVDVLLNYPKFMKRLKLLRQALTRRKPDLLIIVDYPDFNLKLAETARATGIPVLFYISPQIWAWRTGRVKRIGELVSHMAVLFPFEVEVYQKADIPVTFVGHPLVDDAQSDLTQVAAQTHFGIEQGSQLLTLLPGSRRGEIQRNLPVMLTTAHRLLEHIPNCRFLLPLAPTLARTDLDSMLDNSLPITIAEGQACDAMRAADAVLTASGTATLETALIGTPMVVMYVINPINHALMKRMIRIDDIALVNIVAGKRIVPEFIQQAADPQAMADALIPLLHDTDTMQRMREELAIVKARMGEGGASQRVAKLIVRVLEAP